MEDRTKTILANLEHTREELLALSDDIWLSINHNDVKEFESFVEFKRIFNKNLDEYGRLSSEILLAVQKFTKIALDGDEAEEAIRIGSLEGNQVFNEISQDQIHSLDENWTYKRPHGFSFLGKIYKNITYWRQIYQIVCRDVWPEHSSILSQMRRRPGTSLFPSSPIGLNAPLKIADGVYTEGNLSANSIRDSIKEILTAIRADLGDFSVYWRGD